MTTNTKNIWTGTNPTEMQCNGCSSQFHNAFSYMKTHLGVFCTICDDCLPRYVKRSQIRYGTSNNQRYQKQGKHWTK